MQKLETYLREHHKFPLFKQVYGRASIADKYSARNRCGIYVLLFGNGDSYVGQALDVTRRYVQHRKTHDDITNISFKRVAKSKLDSEERCVIWNLESQGFTLRNITFTSTPKGQSDFELIMSTDDQARWIMISETSVLTGTRVQDSTLRRKYSKRYDSFVTKPHAERMTEVLQRYIRVGIPVPIQSEIAFWCCSCLPRYKRKGVTLYSRVNVNWQEVLAASTYQDDLYFSFHLALTPLQAVFGESLDILFEKYQTLGATENFYEPGGHDQINIIIEGFDEVFRLLFDPAVIKAIRAFNLNLMNKGPCVFGRYHCMDLADRLLSEQTASDGVSYLEC